MNLEQDRRSRLFNGALAFWVLLVPILALHSLPDADTVGFGLPLQKDCEVPVAFVNECIDRCDADFTPLAPADEDGNVPVRCEVKLPVGNLTMLDMPVIQLETSMRSSAAPTRVDERSASRNVRPPVPPPQLA